MIFAGPFPSRERPVLGGVLIIVLWVAFGLVAITLYFAHAMSLELRAANNRGASMEAEQAVEGAARYVNYLLANSQTARLDSASSALTSGQRPEGALAIGSAWVWLLKAPAPNSPQDRPAYGLADEGAKININTATRQMLEALPNMTPNLAGAILDWRDEDEDPETDGAESDYYSRLHPAYRCKNAPFASVEELRLVSGFTTEILQGEDLNRNGILDPNENDGDLSPPADNRDGKLDRGLLAFVTVYTRESNLREDGSQRIDVNSSNRDELRSLLEEKLDADRAAAILGRTAAGNRASLLQFYIDSGMKAEEFSQVENDLSVTNAPFREGLVNINTASEEVLAALPGIGTERAPDVVAYRLSHQEGLDSVAWLAEVLEPAQLREVGPLITGRSQQFTADIAAVGHHGHGFRRVQFVLDDSEDSPKIIYRKDLTDLGWSLGQSMRRSLQLANNHSP